MPNLSSIESTIKHILTVIEIRKSIYAENYTISRACFHRRSCPYRHPHLAQAHVEATVEEIPTINTFSLINDLDFQYGLRVLTTAYSNSNNLLYLCPRSSESLSPSFSDVAMIDWMLHVHLASLPSAQRST